MKGKRKAIIAVGAVAMAVIIMGIVLFRGGFVATAYYSNNYNKIFGQFTAKTTNLLLGNEESNMCYSPVSLFAALTLAAETTEDETREEILTALGVDDIEELEEMYTKMLGDIDATTEPSVITLCNSLWVNEECMRDDADKAIEQCVEKLDCEIYKRNPIEVNEVNEWAYEKTNGLIQDIVDPGQYSLILANALYYKAGWMDDFKNDGDKTFIPEKGANAVVPFIKCEKESMGYIEAKDYTSVLVPMQEGHMLFVLPDKDVKLKNLLSEKKLNEILSTATNDRMENGLVTISVPEFQIESDMGEELGKTVREIGIKRLFGDTQWNIISKDASKEVDIRQKTNIKVNEEGVEAAAVTVITAKYLSAAPEQEPELELTLDRPFLYVLIKDGVPLFIGTVYNPAE